MTAGTATPDTEREEEHAPASERSKDAVETAIDRSKDPERTWESAIPSAKRWAKKTSSRRDRNGDS